MSVSANYPVFEFEREDDPTGEWIPMAVRMKLDLVGLKIRLPDWQALNSQDRASLLALDTESAAGAAEFRNVLEHALAAAGIGSPRTLSAEGRETIPRTLEWYAPGPPPEKVDQSLRAVNHSDLWARTDRFGRYVLCKLSRKPADPRFAKAVAELARRAGLDG